MTELLVAVLLLLGNAFFVGGEFALIASRRTVVEPLAATSRRARAALRAMNQIPLMIAGAQLGITICSLGLGAIAEPALAHLLEAPFEALGLPDAAVTRSRFAARLGVVVFLHTVVGEMVPKNLTLAGPERAVLWLGPPMLAFCLATKPLLVAMKWAARHDPADCGGSRRPTRSRPSSPPRSWPTWSPRPRTEGLLDAGGARPHHRRAGAAEPHRRRRDAALVDGHHRGRGRLAGLAGGAGHPDRPVPLPGGAAGHPPGARVRARQGRDGARRAGAAGADPARADPAAGVVPPDRTLADLLLAMRRERRHIVLVSDGRRRSAWSRSTTC